MTLVLLLKSDCLKGYILMAGLKIFENISQKSQTKLYMCLMYREIDVMSTEYRRLYFCYMTANVFVSVMFIHTISLHACVSFGLKLPMSLFFMFLISAINCGVVFICMYTCLGNVCTASKHVLQVQLKTGNSAIQPSTWFRRYLKSGKILGNVDLNHGNANFAEPLTPLNAEEFSVEQSISLMLLEN